MTSLQLYATNLEKVKAASRNDPQVKRETDYFSANIKNAKSVDDFVGNYRLFSYAMKAYGLEEMTYANGFMKKVLSGGVINPNSFANQLSDPRFRKFAFAFDFADRGPSVTSTASIVATTTSKYVEQMVEEQAGQQNVGAQLALYFQRNASSIKSGMSVLADKAIFQFMQTAYSLPTSMGSNIDTQAALIEKKVNFADFQDPAKVQKLMQKFAVLWDVNNGDIGGTQSAALTLLQSSGSGSGSIIGIDPSLILNFRRV